MREILFKCLIFFFMTMNDLKSTKTKEKHFHFGKKKVIFQVSNNIQNKFISNVKTNQKTDHL